MTLSAVLFFFPISSMMIRTIRVARRKLVFPGKLNFRGVPSGKVVFVPWIERISLRRLISCEIGSSENEICILACANALRIARMTWSSSVRSPRRSPSCIKARFWPKAHTAREDPTWSYSRSPGDHARFRRSASNRDDLGCGYRQKFAARQTHRGGSRHAKEV